MLSYKCDGEAPIEKNRGHITEYLQCYKGTIPIEKNIVVTDVNGRIIGSTYLKRAKGLVKNGRAEYADDHTIRLKFTHASTVDIKYGGITKMSKVINFNARDFKLDTTCDSNVGERVFVTTSFGNIEVWEIGNWGWNWSQIFCVKSLEKNTDYVLRFAMMGGYNDIGDAVSQVQLYGVDGYEKLEAAWEDRMTFALDKSRFEPVISKRDKTELFRVFEIPFNTGEHANWRIVFVAQHAVARFFAPQEFSEYEKLNDLTYDDWWEERNNNSLPSVRMKTPKTTKYNEKQFAALLKTIGDGTNSALNNITVYSDRSGEFFDIGVSIDGAVLDLSNAMLTARAFSMILNKLGDGCVLNMKNTTVTKEGIDKMYNFDEKVDGTAIMLDEATLPQKALDMVYDKLGYGCHISTGNCAIE